MQQGDLVPLAWHSTWGNIRCAKEKVGVPTIVQGAGPASKRHLTAMVRTDLSKPVSLAIADEILKPSSSFFDYGCGRGGDLQRLTAMGYEARGWDPAHRPDAKIRPADVVNLGYVVNVIEDPAERLEALRSAWALTGEVLIVSARPDWEARSVLGRPHGDGIITSKGTFQKFFAQEELRAWLDSGLSVRSVAAAPGIFYVFRDEVRAQSFLASRVRYRPVPVCRPRVTDVLYDANREAMESLAAFVTGRGRLPEAWELGNNGQKISDAFSSVKRAAAVLRRVLGEKDWDGDFAAARDRASKDLLVYLALAALTGRPKASRLPPDVALDVKALFGSYKAACEQADLLLRQVANQRAINTVCTGSPIGKLTPDALYVHASALGSLDPLLRVYEGCARALTGAVPGATLIKFTRTAAKVSYLAYPSFDQDPHPALSVSLRADLPRLHVKYRDFSASANPPVLHRKETFVPEGYPGREKFSRLTRQEERAGLLEEALTIGTRAGWQRRLDELGYRLAGHRLVRAANES
ncbi:DNA phosphorothioation-associated putative methyltransferase [Micromonospora sp. DR5-3]|uniref:DNA phosphorothioation-associated putative methyltransferase n=1 Tax=unclassified Micromonospora TaxID=2617518 RepID=UPI0011D6316D|nr:MULTISPECIES: DNA phosphorothioation-associated putative methyltransferase [unclassified Micromonospora]MCW3817844.1 DNA phosphorothioation-associated putative methyltransferase [Micromonospora sp. DR5-3]TYC12769.1 DNA phosphorothioation-associated putative methyltransferase [Micromonospora sp. MP36]